MSQNSQEQRNTRRFSLKLPMTVRLDSGNVSTVASQTTLTESIRVRCTGKVVRVDQSAGKQVGIAAAIDQYDFVND
jgi:hypothetical protein